MRTARQRGAGAAPGRRRGRRLTPAAYLPGARSRRVPFLLVRAGARAASATTSAGRPSTPACFTQTRCGLFSYSFFPVLFSLVCVFSVRLFVSIQSQPAAWCAVCVCACVSVRATCRNGLVIARVHAARSARPLQLGASARARLRRPPLVRPLTQRAAPRARFLKLRQGELISGDRNGNIRVWDLAKNSCRWRPRAQAGVALLRTGARTEHPSRSCLRSRALGSCATAAG